MDAMELFTDDQKHTLQWIQAEKGTQKAIDFYDDLTDQLVTDHAYSDPIPR
jgi:hypothetical protein